MEVSIVMGAPPSHPYSNNGIFHKNPPAIKGYPHFPMAMDENPEAQLRSQLRNPDRLQTERWEMTDFSNRTVSVTGDGGFPKTGGIPRMDSL